MRYVDGYVLPISRKKLGQYRRLAALASRVWRDHGALEYCEAAGDDLNVNCGLPFPKLTRCKSGETVIFAWVVYKSRAHRDRVNEAVLKDPRLASLADTPMPFDMKRMTMGGFKVLVSA